ncbi:MAG: tetratricopeptide repeat protein [Clostridia bacterium]|nr:tetratricopeptide repeat protein [Clostridia bacterium]
MAVERDEYEEKRCLLSMTDPEDRAANAERIPIRHMIDKLDRTLARGDYGEGMRLLDYWLREAQALGDEDGELSVASELMGLSRRVNDREKGLAAIARGLALLEKSGLTDTVSGATILLNAATTKKHFGDAAGAIPLYRRAEEVYSARLSPDDERFGGLYNNYALSLAETGERETAEAYFNRALSVMEKNGAKGKTGVAVTCVNLADFFEAGDDPDKDEKINAVLERAWAALDDPDTPRDGEYAFVASKCAPAFSFYGWFFAAAELEKRMREIHERN